MITALAKEALGVMILLNKQKMRFYYPCNALKKIYGAPETSSVFPPLVWYYLNYRNPNTNDKRLKDNARVIPNGTTPNRTEIFPRFCRP